MNRLSRILVIICGVLFLGGVASADTLTFSLSGPVTASFQLPSQLSIPPSEFQTGFGFVIPGSMLIDLGANLTINNVHSGDFLAFYNATGAFGGGFAAFPNAFTADIFLVGGGQQIYSGTEASPMFSNGTFTFSDGSVLTISGGTTVGTPEPSVTFLLNIGLLAFGLIALRFKRGFAAIAS